MEDKSVELYAIAKQLLEKENFCFNGYFWELDQNIVHSAFKEENNPGISIHSRQGDKEAIYIASVTESDLSGDSIRASSEREIKAALSPLICLIKHWHERLTNLLTDGTLKVYGAAISILWADPVEQRLIISNTFAFDSPMSGTGFDDFISFCESEIKKQPVYNTAIYAVVRASEVLISPNGNMTLLQEKEVKVLDIYEEQEKEDESKLGVNHAVFTILLEENPSLFTTEGLQSLLMDCVHRCVKPEKIVIHKSLVHDQVWLALSDVFESPRDLDLMRRILISPAEFNLEPPKGIEEGSNFYSNIGSLFGAKAMTDKFVFDIIRDNIQNIQRQLNISGIIVRHDTIRDRTLSHHCQHGELILLDKDRAILAEEMPKVIEFFLEVINVDPAYELFIEDEEGDLSPCDTSKLSAIANNATAANLRSESTEWKLDPAAQRRIGRSINIVHPDEITLCLYMDKMDEYQTEIFTAIHPEDNRQHWLL